MWLYSYPSILLSTSHQNGGAVLEQWGPVSQSPVGQEVTSLRTRLSTPPMLGLAVLVLTIVPAYLLSRPNATDTARTVVSIARSNDSAEAATDEFTAVEIEAHIRAVAIRYRIAPLLVAAIVEAESEFNPRAVSRKGARGLMQLMPLTASSLRVEDTFDPYENIEGGVRHLRQLMDRYHGNLPLVLAAYNAGEQAVTVYGGVPPYRETRRYISRILRRIGRPELLPRVSSASHAVVPVSTSRSAPAITYAVANPTRSAWAERQFLERQVPAPAMDHGVVPAPRAVAEYARPTRSNGEGP